MLRCIIALALWPAVMGSPGARAADLELGEYLAQECTACHSAAAAGKGIPPIGGWPAAYMVDVLGQYRSGARDNPTMVSVARSLTDEDVAALAAWFETQPPPTASGTKQ